MNGRLIAAKERKNQYKHALKRETLYSIIQAESVLINLTEMKTLLQKGMILELKKGKKTKHQRDAIIQETEAGEKLEILILVKIKAKAQKGLYFHQEITKTEAQEVTPRINVENTIKRKETFSKW